jgi:hypothetical protein
VQSAGLKPTQIKSEIQLSLNICICLILNDHLLNTPFTVLLLFGPGAHSQQAELFFLKALQSRRQ